MHKIILSQISVVRTKKPSPSGSQWVPVRDILSFRCTWFESSLRFLNVNYSILWTLCTSHFLFYIHCFRRLSHYVVAILSCFGDNRSCSLCLTRWQAVFSFLLLVSASWCKDVACFIAFLCPPIQLYTLRQLQWADLIPQKVAVVTRL